MIDGRADIIFQILGSDADVHAVRHLEWFTLFGGHFFLDARRLGRDMRSGSFKCSGNIHWRVLHWDGLVGGAGRGRLGLSLREGIFAEVLNDLQRCFAVDFFNVLLEIPHSAFAAVVLDEHVDGGRVQHNVCVLKSGSFLCLRAEISLCNHRLLFRDVARDFDDFHSVEERCWNCIEYIG